MHVILGLPRPVRHADMEPMDRLTALGKTDRAQPTVHRKDL